MAQAIVARRHSLRRNVAVKAGAPPDALALQAIHDVAIAMSSMNGESSPSGGVVYSSSRKVVESVLSGAVVDTDQPVFAVVLHGNFVGHMAKTPLGIPPTGHVLTIDFDAATLEITDWGITPAEPAGLTTLGQPTNLGL